MYQLVQVRRPLSANFTQLPNDLVRNFSLSLKARGLLALLLSLSPKAHVSLDRLSAGKLDGEAAVRSAMKELEKHGYLHVVRERGPTGQFVRTRWLVSDQPIMDWTPYLGNRAVDKPAVAPPANDIPPHTNTKLLEKQKTIRTTTAMKPSTLQSLSIDDRNRESWLWFCEKLSLDPEKTRRDCGGLDQAMAIDLLAEAYGRKQQGSIRTSVPQLLTGLIHRARDGKFNLCAGAHIRADMPEILRRQRAVQLAALPALAPSVPHGSVNITSPKEHIENIKHLLKHPKRDACQLETEHERS
ncbi:hypothetical protein [Massilia horti]|uniref:Helix-turn-helix domain-containing protein n=1 Tax=Massilia horti TaxID=2562153 RepID=A0A4Y9T180_9BURK|nr:hypothetical protein [Massilia horti]TFW30756.1 hypothetical protein E4O92_15590 [Massilia horti]